MTRKDVCKATGLTVKTLRLYEEKGLIIPERQYRNGREYRVYTPQLVEELQKIVMLRKALFTMDEIRTMQRSPDAIPQIFETYRQWLTVQEQTFRLLRQTAQNIDADSLTSLDGLVTDLQKAARQMPLPQMDRSPDFKHIDAMEEPPRHVTPQSNLDDTVPNARVFRQVNLVMDSDCSNNVNLAFGQYNEARRSAPAEPGPVRESFQLPRWQRMAGSLLTALTALFAVLGIYQELAHQWFDDGLWGLFGLFLLLRLLLAAIPHYQSHRRWQKKAQQKDQAAGGDAYRAAAAADKKRRNRILICAASGSLVAIALIAILCRVMYRQAHPEVDYTIGLITSVQVDDRILYKLEQALSPAVGDLDGNGQAVTELTQRSFSNEQWSGDQYIDRSGFQECATEGTYPLLFLLDHDSALYGNALTALNSSQYFAPLPEDIPSADGYHADLTTSPVLQKAGLDKLRLLACIPIGDSPEQAQLALQILRSLMRDA